MDRRSNQLTALFVDTVIDFMCYEEDRDGIATVLQDYGLELATVHRILLQPRRYRSDLTERYSNSQQGAGLRGQSVHA